MRKEKRNSDFNDGTTAEVQRISRCDIFVSVRIFCLFPRIGARLFNVPKLAEFDGRTGMGFGPFLFAEKRRALVVVLPVSLSKSWF